MNLELTQDQAALLSGVEAIVARHGELPVAHRRDYSYYSRELDRQLVDSGFMDVIQEPGMSGLEAALVVIAAAQSPAAVEVGASALIAARFTDIQLPRPISLISGDIGKAQRYLPVAKTALVVVDGDVLALAVDPANIETVETIFAFPYGRFRVPPGLAGAARFGPDAARTVRQWWRVSLAAECAGLMRAAVDFTVAYVKQRHLFGTTLSSYQAVQHRLAQCHQIATGAYYLTLKAAWSGDEFDALQAASFAQQHIPKLTFDLHQFNGGMGVTNEHKLHFWTYRFRALQAEMGGANGAALETADRLWGPPQARATAG